MNQETEKMPERQPGQTQDQQPGQEREMRPRPIVIRENYRGSGKLAGKVAFITGGDSGIGRAAAVHFAHEGATVALNYLNEDQDAFDTQDLVEDAGGSCLLIPGDVGDPDFCRKAIEDVKAELGNIHVLVCNAGEQHPREEIKEIAPEQLERTFRTNFFGTFYMVQAALPHLREGDSIIITSSVTAYKGHEMLLDYASTKGALTTFTRSLSAQLAPKGIRVNAIAPGPIWTPLIPSTFPKDKVKEFGKDTPLGRAGQPCELGPAYVFLACEDSSYVTGQTIHINGGSFVGS